MHGTFRTSIDDEAAPAMPFDGRTVATRGPWRAPMAVLLAGCCLAVLSRTAPPPKTAEEGAATADPPAWPIPARLALAPAQRPKPAAADAKHIAAQPLKRERRTVMAMLRPPATQATVIDLPAPRTDAGWTTARSIAEQVEPLDPIFVRLPDAIRAPAIRATPLSSPPLSVELPNPPAPRLAAAAPVVRPPNPPSAPAVAVSLPRAPVPHSAAAAAPPAMRLPAPSTAPALTVNLPVLPTSRPRAAPRIEDFPVTPAPPLAIDLADPPAPQLADALRAAPSPAPAAQSSPSSHGALRPVDVAQISDSDVRSLRVPQLHEPGLAVGGEPTLAAKIAAMQVTPLPPVRYPASERAVLLAQAPTQMIVRIGGTALGKVDFRMSEDHTIDVRLAGLLDLLAGHYDAAEFARLRQSAAADAYVSFDKLRAMGLNVRYDPAYDEVRIAG